MLLMFLCIMIGGFLFLLFSLIFGADHEAEVDYDADHDGDYDTDSGTIKHRWFSVKVISAFATGFGAVGSIIRSNGGGVFWSLAGALACGIVMAVIADAIILFFLKQQASSHISNQQLIGMVGEVTLTIKPDSFGEVSVFHHGHRISGRAKCPQEVTISQGSTVKIIKAEGTTFVVQAE